MFVSFTHRITALRYIYGCATLSLAYVCKLCLKNHGVTLKLWLPILRCRLCFLAQPTETLAYTRLMCVQPEVQPIYRITGLRYTYECASLS